jgi:hypothetical protein
VGKLKVHDLVHSSHSSWSPPLSQMELAGSKNLFLQVKYYFEKTSIFAFMPQFIQNVF